MAQSHLIRRGDPASRSPSSPRSSLPDRHRTVQWLLGAALDSITPAVAAKAVERVRIVNMVVDVLVGAKSISLLAPLLCLHRVSKGRRGLRHGKVIAANPTRSGLGFLTPQARAALAARWLCLASFVCVRSCHIAEQHAAVAPLHVNAKDGSCEVQNSTLVGLREIHHELVLVRAVFCLVLGKQWTLAHITSNPSALHIESQPMALGLIQGLHELCVDCALGLACHPQPHRRRAA